MLKTSIRFINGKFQSSTNTGDCACWMFSGMLWFRADTPVEKSFRKRSRIYLIGISNARCTELRFWVCVLYSTLDREAGLSMLGP